MTHGDHFLYISANEEIMKRYIETWKANNLINLALLESIHADCFNELVLQKRLMNEFAHIHRVRMLWLQQNTPELFTELNDSFPPEFHKQSLLDALSKSGEAMTKMIEQKFEEGRVKGFATPGAFLNYIVSQESQCRNEILLMIGFLNTPGSLVFQ
jgi:hypothetical protein